MRRYLLLLLVALLPATAHPALGQDAPPQRGDVAHANEARARYLAAKPYHSKVFEDLVTALRAQRAMPAWIARYQAAHEAGDAAGTVVLARLYDAEGRRAKALALLEALGGDVPRRDALVGELHLDGSDPAAALPWLDRAVEGLEAGEERDRALRHTAEAYLLLGARDEAAATFTQLVDGAPDDLDLRLEVAELCARGGLRSEAIEHYRAAEQLAGEDAERRSRVLAELGALHERELRPDDAEAAYVEALDLLGRGHWLEEELLDRLVELHRRRGTLLAWRTTLEERLASTPDDLGTVERLARARVATGDAEGALDVLANAARRHGSDLVLADRRLQFARSHGTPAQRVAVLQDTIAASPQDVELRFELAEALASDENLDGARIQWAQVLEGAGRDPEAVARVARRRGAWGEGDAALALFEQARDLAPHDLSRHADLARHLAALGRVDVASDGLVQAERRFNGPRVLEELATLQQEFGRPDRAEAPLLRACALLPDEDRLALSLAELWIALDRVGQARPHLRALIDEARDLGLRDRAVRSYVGSFRAHPALAVAAEEEAQRAREGGARASYLLSVAMYQELRDFAGARMLLEEFLVVFPEDRAARVQLASLLAGAGAKQEALRHYAELVARFPGSAREWRLNRAKLFTDLGEVPEASAELEAIVAAEPKNSKALEEASRAFAELGRPDRAIEILGLSLDLDAADAPGHLRMAGLCLDDFRFAEAHQHLLAAYREGSGRVREDALETLHGLMVSQARVRFEMESLARVLEERPFDLPTAFLIIDLHVAEKQYRQSLEVLAGQLERRPYEVRLFRRRAAIHKSLGLYEEAVRDLSSVRALMSEPPPELLYELLEAHVSAGKRVYEETRPDDSEDEANPVRVGFDEAVRVAMACEEPLRAARILSDAGLHSEAAQVLNQARRAQRPDPELDRRLGEVHARLGEVEPAIAAFRRYLDAGGEDLLVLRRLGDLYWEQGKREEALAMGARLLRGSASPANTRAWFKEKGLLAEWIALRCDRVLAHPRDGEGVEQLLEDLSGEAVYPIVLDTLAQLTRATLVEGQVPPGRSPLHWARMLRAHELLLLVDAPPLALARLAAARTVVAQPGPLSDLSVALDLIAFGHPVDDEAGLAEVERALGGHPLVALALARLREDEGRHAAAAAHYQAAAAALDDPAVVAGEQGERTRLRRELAQGLRSELPYEVRAALGGERLDQLLDLVEAGHVLDHLLDQVPLDPGGARARAARALAASGDEDAARSVMRAQVSDALGAPGCAALALLAAEAGFDDLARDLTFSLDAYAVEVESQEVFAPAVEAVDLVDGLYDSYAAALREAGAAALAYDVLRDLRRVEHARSLASEPAVQRQLVHLYDEELRNWVPDASATRDAAWWAQVRALHDTALKLGELHEWDDQSARARKAWIRVEVVLPRDRSVLTMRAVHAERSGHREDALAARRALVEVLDGGGAPPPEALRDEWLSPRIAGLEPRARRSVTWLHLSNFARRPTQDARLDHLIVCLRLELELGQVSSALGTLGRIVALAKDPPASWVRNLLHMLGGYAEIEGMPERLHAFQGALHRLAPENLQVVDAYVKSLWDANELDRAQEVLTTYLATDPRISSFDRKSIETMVESTEHLRRLRRGQSDEVPGDDR